MVLAPRPVDVADAILEICVAAGVQLIKVSKLAYAKALRRLPTAQARAVQITFLGWGLAFLLSGFCTPFPMIGLQAHALALCDEFMEALSPSRRCHSFAARHTRCFDALPRLEQDYGRCYGY